MNSKYCSNSRRDKFKKFHFQFLFYYIAIFSENELLNRFCNLTIYFKSLINTYLMLISTKNLCSQKCSVSQPDTFLKRPYGDAAACHKNNFNSTIPPKVLFERAAAFCLQYPRFLSPTILLSDASSKLIHGNAILLLRLSLIYSNGCMIKFDVETQESTAIKEIIN